MGGLIVSEEYACIGCGVKIQTDNPDELGYTPTSALEKEVPLFANVVFA